MRPLLPRSGALRRAAGFAAAAGAAALTLAAGPAAAEPTPADQLEGLCVTEGRAPETCACLKDFVSERFTPREIEGAWLVLADPAMTEDPFAAIGMLTERGYTLPEILDVTNRVVELGEAAEQTCAVPTAPTDPSAPNEAG